MILERRKTKELSRLALARFANRAQRAAGLVGEVNILLTGDAEMQRLNRQFRRLDKPTDVLSFPAPAAGSAALSARAPAAGSAALPASASGRQRSITRGEATSAAGDIAISVAAARAQAAACGHSLLTEVKVLILHGLLHLAGYDHERDRGQMRRLEQKLRAELHLTAGLIERTRPSRGAFRSPSHKPGASPAGRSGRPK